jgi:NADPH:quinone reductase-like Zn-dependent oxidoreductase
VKAAWFERKGTGADIFEIGEMATPAPGEGEVRVRLAFAGINPSDYKRRDPSRNGTAMEYPRVISGMDGSGTIDEVGAGVDARRRGERVWVYEAQLGRAFGSYAQYVVVPQRNAVALPDGVSFEEGACLGVPAMTAHRAVFADGPVRGKNVLVAGGAGAVGFFAAQFAAWGGANVVATVRSPEKARVLRDAGFTAIVNTREGDPAAAIRSLAGGRGVDRIVEVDFSENFELDRAVLAAGGVISTYSPSKEAGGLPPPGLYTLMRMNATIAFVYVYAMSDEAKAAAVADITTALRSGALKNGLKIVRFPLEQAGAAQEQVERGTLGGRALLVL